jgi:hypothetical protein
MESRLRHEEAAKEDIMTARGSQVIQNWPEESLEATQVVIDQLGEPDEATESFVVWHERGPWKRIVASRAHHLHNFPRPHPDVVESFVDYRVPPDKLTAIVQSTAAWSSTAPPGKRPPAATT